MDARRPLRELGGRPLHDLSMRLTGPPGRGPRSACSWSSGRRDGTRRGRSTPAAKTPDARGLHLSATTCLAQPRPTGATEILDALLEGHRGAPVRSIYIEHQYLSARSIVAALAAALERERDLEIIAVLNENADVTAYRRWQNARLEESGLLKHPRVGLFALWSAARGPDRTLLNQVFVHSKVVAVDDVWATAGSANLDGVSLHSYGDDFTGRGPPGVPSHAQFRRQRGRRGAARAASISRVAALWSEHLGSPRAALAERPAGGWLPLWRAQAAANVAALDAARSAAAPDARIRASLQRRIARRRDSWPISGVRVDPARLDVRFNPGWLEVHFSPNWVRNMFS